jgi:opacity protein-like surface antigen
MQRLSLLAIFFLSASLPLCAQVVPSAMGHGLPEWSAGAGFSYFSSDIGIASISGGTLWVNYALSKMPSFLYGIGLELEARDLQPHGRVKKPILREDTAGIGLTYNFKNYRNVRPYAKAVFGPGNIDFVAGADHRFNESRIATSLGGGFDVRTYRNLWVRADYVYQYYPDFYTSKVAPNPTGGRLDPHGFTFGAVYHLAREHSAR